MSRSCPALCAGLLLVCNLGCGGEAPKGAAPAAEVKGTIRLDGKPIPTGELHFNLAGFPPRVLHIANGAFSGQAPVGKNRLELFIYGDAKAAGKATKVNIAPGTYWGPKSTLEAIVTADGPNDFKFDLTSR